MASKSLFGLLSLLLLAGGIIFMFFILLAGAVDGYPVNRFYFLEADTSNIPNALLVSRWTYWNVCGKDGSRTVCGDKHYENVRPAFPLDPPSHREFNTHVNVPANVFAICTRLGAYLSSFFAILAFFFQTIQASLMTAAYTKGRNNFRHNGQSAHVGSYAFGFQWAAFTCFFLATIFLCIGGSSGRQTKVQSSAPRKSFFRVKRSKSTRSRGSFIDGTNKEYS
ncbi:hypothetical protein DV736_g530, partial [Chaetothyriales sp. CBS 134916]